MKISTVFISHSAGQSIEPLLTLLKAENVKSYGFFLTWPSYGHDISEGILSAISKSDAVIAVLSKDSGVANVIFEIGYATALRKAILLLIDPAASMPEFMHNVRHIVSDVADSNVLRIGIRKFLEASTKSSSSRRKYGQPKTPVNSNESTIRALVNRIGRDRTTIDGQTAERIVADLLRASAVTLVEEQSGSKDIGVDFAVWSDALETSLGNPILIEVKSGNLDDVRLQSA